MIITDHNKPSNNDAVSHNDDSDLHKDEMGENSVDDTGLAKAFRADEENR